FARALLREAGADPPRPDPRDVRLAQATVLRPGHGRSQPRDSARHDRLAAGRERWLTTARTRRLPRAPQPAAARRVKPALFRASVCCQGRVGGYPGCRTSVDARRLSAFAERPRPATDDEVRRRGKRKPRRETSRHADPDTYQKGRLAQ